MKTRNKLLIALAFVVMASSAAAGTSAFAWFSARRQSLLAVNSIGAVTQFGDLAGTASSTVVHGKDIDSTGSTANNIILSTTTQLQPVSSDGNVANMANAVYDSGNYSGTPNPAIIGYTAAVEDTTNNYYNYYEFSITFTLPLNASGAVSALYLDPTALNCVQTTDASAAQDIHTWVRFSVLSETTRLIYVNPGDNTATPAYTYHTSSDTSSTAPTSVGTAGTDFGIANKASTKTTVANATKSDYNSRAKYYLGSLDPTTETGRSLTFNFVVWLEGTTGDIYISDAATSANLFGKFAMSMGFYTIVADSFPNA